VSEIYAVVFINHLAITDATHITILFNWKAVNVVVIVLDPNVSICKLNVHKMNIIIIDLWIGKTSVYLKLVKT
jgi:hypothetical protein